jgi:hypothetical protein
VLFALPFGQYRDAIYGLTEELGVSVDYASWKDGFEPNADLIEQDLSQNVYSEFISSDMYQVELINNGRRTYRLTKKRLVEFPLVIDLVDNKIFISGEKVDSKKIPSQKAACQIFSKLYESKKWMLENTHLPKSYATSRFDLQSKVISPMEKSLGFKFEISGTSFEKFSLSLKNLPPEIAIIRRIAG